MESRNPPATTQTIDGASATDGLDTRERLLEAAEELYAQHGIEATSLRQITAHARANVAAVNYHFGSKKGLTEEVFRRHLAPLNAERIRLLDDAEAKARRGGPSIEAIVRAFLSPTIEHWERHPQFMRLLGRLQFEPDVELHRFYLAQFDEILHRFKAATTQALPHLPERELLWRTHFVIGGMLHTWTCHADLVELSEGLCQMHPYADVVERLVRFAVAGLKAPLGPKLGGRRRP